MSDVQEIEASIGRHDAAAVPAQLAAKFRRIRQRHNSAQHPPNLTRFRRLDKPGSVFR